MKLGMVGLPNVGKSTLFNAITSAGAESANYPFCTIEPNVGVVSVPDERLSILRDLVDSQKCIPTAIEFFDIAGLVKGASKGEGLGNQFLSHIREVDAIVHVVRCFDDDEITHVEGKIDPINDIDVINLELIFSDLELINTRLDRLKKLVKNDKTYLKEQMLLEKIKDILEEGKSIRNISFEDDEKEILHNFNLISQKPILYAANVSEDDLVSDEENPYVIALKEHVKSEDSEVIVVSAQIESEISELDDDEKTTFLEELGIKESGLDKLIKASYKLLGLISFLTAGPKEIRAWTIRDGSKAPEAAGKIHSDMEKGFIRAEIVSFDDLSSSGGYLKAKENGLVRLEGKDYIMKNGDIANFRFNV